MENQPTQESSLAHIALFLFDQVNQIDHIQHEEISVAQKKAEAATHALAATVLEQANLSPEEALSTQSLSSDGMQVAASCAGHCFDN
jgi:hypothetical protein